MFFSCVNLVHANLEITEIMYNPNLSGTDYDWIEIHNNGTRIEDLTKYYFYADANGISSTSTRHGITGVNALDSNEYAIITSDSIDNFKSKYAFSGTVFHSSFDIGSTVETTLAITSDSTKPPAEDQTYKAICDPTKGANNDGNSLQLINGKWEPAIPTPGEENVLNTNSDTSSSTNNDDNSSTSTSSASTSSTSSTSSTPKEIPVIYKIFTKIIAPKIVTAGVPFDIDHLTTGIHKENIILGKFIWNFGDGRQKQLSVSDPFNYVYDYPGEYVLTLSYSDSIFDTKPDATDRLTIKVIPSGVVISSVGTYTDPFVEIENNSSYEMSLNKWILKGSVHSFSIPEGMVILPNKKLKLSPKITGFDFNDLSSISIIDTSGQVFATYPKQKIYSTKNYSNSNSQGNIVKADIVTSDQVAGIVNSPDVINLNDLGASAENTDNGLNNKTLIYLGLAGIIAIGLLSIFLIRRKTEIPDYVEKGISASDMTIME
jgi:hypothetical protein